MMTGNTVSEGSHGRRLAEASVAAGSGAGLWGIVYPLPYDVCLPVLIAIPALALLAVALSRGQWSLNDDPLNGKAVISGMVHLPIAALLLRGVLDQQMPAWRPQLLTAAALAVVLVLLVAAVERRFRPKTLWLTGLLCLAYSWGGLVYLNAALDRSAPEVFRAQVLNRTIMANKPYAYDIFLTAWGPYGSGHIFDVGRGFHDRVRIGDTVCASLYRGRFGWRHFHISACPAP